MGYDRNIEQQLKKVDIINIHYIKERHKPKSMKEEKDYLEVRKGRKGLAPLYGRYCGDDIPTVITVESGVYMKFHSDGIKQRRGFKGNYRVGDCFGHYTGLEGRLVTSNFPNPFSKLQCEWRIIVPENLRIRLDFKTFDINSDVRGLCWARGYYFPDYSTIIVRNGLKRDDTQTVARYCGQYAPTVLSSSNSLIITLYTDDGGWGEKDKGFEAFYYAEAPQCEYRINIGQPAPRYGFYPTRGNITSQNYTADFPDSDGCIWVINSRRDPILLQFTEFDIAGNDECTDEYVEVRDGDSETSPLIGRFCSHDHLQAAMVSTGKHLFLRLQRSDSSNQGIGFAVAYETGLYRYFNGSEGFISERGIEVKWTGFIEVPKGFLVYLEFPVFSMASHHIDDHLIMYDGTEYTESGFLGSYEGTYAPPILAKGNVVTILYRKYWTSEGIGADIKYQAIEPSCTTILKAGNGTITNIDVQSQLTQYTECEWRIYSYTDPLVIIEFEEFDLIQSENCR
ncbi:tolloid-like protein 2 [Glandiceps talaboti]